MKLGQIGLWVALDGADHVCFKPVGPDKSTDMRIVELLAPRN